MSRISYVNSPVQFYRALWGVDIELMITQVTNPILDINRQNGVGDDGEIYRWIMTQNSQRQFPSMRECDIQYSFRDYHSLNAFPCLPSL